jgi:tRNA threonylcarbamoyladenosine biosynthesis protein TsaB
MASVAMNDDDYVLGEITLLNRLHHSQMILKMIDSLIKESGVSLDRVDLFAVSVGPGSFTGLRVGLATMKGLATGLGKPLTGVPTLEAFARQLPYTPFPISPLIPARKGEVYTALYQYDQESRLALLKPARVIPVSGLRQEIKGPLHLLGDLPPGWEVNPSDEEIYYSPQFRYPRASSVAQTALLRVREGGGISEEEPGTILPAYPSGKAEAGGMFL